MIQSDFPTRQPAPKIGSNGNWWEWDELTQAYVDTGKPSRGEDGTGGGVFVARINSTTSAEIEAAYQAGKVVLLPIPRTNAIARLTGRDDAVTHHFGAVFSDSSAEDLVAVHVTCVSDSWRTIATTLLANRATISSNRFSPETTYSVGDYVLYRGFLYRFTAAHTGAWADGDVVQVRLAEDVKDLRAALDGKGTYSKPSGGIPKTDLAAAVQTSLDKADTALQEHQDISGKADQAIIAPVEAAMTATRNYMAGDLLIVGNALYKATANIANGGAITVGTNVSAVILSQQLSSGGSAVPEWQLLGEYDIDQLRGENETWEPNINLSNLDGLTDLYFRWESIQNATSTASAFGNILINGRTVCSNSLIPIGKSGQVSYGYTRAHWNGLTWEVVKAAGAASATNYGAGNVSVLYNEAFNVGACNTLQVFGPAATYRPKTGILKIYGGK